MEALFELKNPKPFDAELFGIMKETALALIKGAEKNPYSQAIVLQTARGQEYAVWVRDALSDSLEIEKMLSQMLQEQDVEIHHVLCLWQDGGLDLPSYAFRKRLLDFSPLNSEAGIFVKTASGISVIGLGSTMRG